MMPLDTILYPDGFRMPVEAGHKSWMTVIGDCLANDSKYEKSVDKQRYSQIKLLFLHVKNR